MAAGLTEKWRYSQTELGYEAAVVSRASSDSQSCAGLGAGGDRTAQQTNITGHLVTTSRTTLQHRTLSPPSAHLTTNTSQQLSTNWHLHTVCPSSWSLLSAGYSDQNIKSISRARQRFCVFLQAFTGFPSSSPPGCNVCDNSPVSCFVTHNTR